MQLVNMQISSFQQFVKWIHSFWHYKKGPVYMNLNERMCPWSFESVEKPAAKSWTQFDQLFFDDKQPSFSASITLFIRCDFWWLFPTEISSAAENMSFSESMTNKRRTSLVSVALLLFCHLIRNNASVRFDRIFKPVITYTGAEFNSLSRTYSMSSMLHLSFLRFLAKSTFFA